MPAYSLHFAANGPRGHLKKFSVSVLKGQAHYTLLAQLHCQFSVQRKRLAVFDRVSIQGGNQGRVVKVAVHHKSRDCGSLYMVLLIRRSSGSAAAARPRKALFRSSQPQRECPCLQGARHGLCAERYRYVQVFPLSLQHAGTSRTRYCIFNLIFNSIRCFAAA